MSVALSRMLKLYYRILDWVEDSNMKLPFWWWVQCPTAHSNQNRQRQRGKSGMVARKPQFLVARGFEFEEEEFNELKKHHFVETYTMCWLREL